jgi:hypothetical protein
VPPPEVHTEQKQVPMTMVPMPPPPEMQHTVQMQVGQNLPCVCRHLGSHEQQVHQDLRNQAPCASHTWPSPAPTRGGASSWAPRPQPSAAPRPQQTAPGRRSSPTTKPPPSPQRCEQQQQRRPPRQICSPCGAGAARGWPGDGAPCPPGRREGRRRWARRRTAEATSSSAGAAAPGGSLGSRPRSS